MRLWSLHPRYLDRQGLIALWREGLLAQKVLAGKTKGYRHHPQLIRFREARDPLAAIGLYLSVVAEEADRRRYRFDTSKLLKISRSTKSILVTQGQLEYERLHLLRKLKIRDPALYKDVAKRKRLLPHPIFRSTPGKIQPWEKT